MSMDGENETSHSLKLSEKVLKYEHFVNEVLRRDLKLVRFVRL